MRNPHLEAAIIERPDDAATFLVYGDWLLEQDDPRGDLVAVQAKLAASPTAELRAQEKALLEAHSGEWLGELAGEDKYDFEHTWHFGFLKSARLGAALEITDAYKTLLELPSAAFLRELTVCGVGDASWADLLALFLDEGLPPTLRALSLLLEDQEAGGEGQSLEELYPLLEKLEALRVELEDLSLGDIPLPGLRSLELSGCVTQESLSTIQSKVWPNLERLVLRFPTDRYSHSDDDCSVDDLLPLFVGAKFPKLTHLGLVGFPSGDELAMALPAAPILKKLRVLDVSDGNMHNEGALALLEQAKAFKHLRELNVTGNLIDDDVARQLRKLCALVRYEDQAEDM